MLVILKIPVVYLCAVVWWAIRAEPLPLEGAGRLAPLPTPPECGWLAARACASPGPRPARRRSRRQARRLASTRARVQCERHYEGPVQTLVCGRYGRGIARDDLHLRQRLGMIYRPVRIMPFAIIIALIAARMSARQPADRGHRGRVGVVCWTVGMTIAVVTENPLYLADPPFPRCECARRRRPELRLRPSAARGLPRESRRGPRRVA